MNVTPPSTWFCPYASLTVPHSGFPCFERGCIDCRGSVYPIFFEKPLCALVRRHIAPVMRNAFRKKIAVDLLWC